MRVRALLSATIISTGLVAGISACSTDPHQWFRHTPVANEEARRDPIIAADRFVKQVNYARLALAMNDGALAMDHVASAQELADIIGNEDPKQRLIVEAKAGMISYGYMPKYKYFYFPIETFAGQKDKTNNPKWISKGMKITDAEIVYLTLNLNRSDLQQRLSQAKAAINAHRYQDAGYNLGILNKEVVTDYTEIPDTLERARDNIALARRFVIESNYPGARYALKHADDALDDMQSDDNYGSHRAAIIALRKQVKKLERTVAKNNPTLMEKTDATMDGWWNEIKGWAHE